MSLALTLEGLSRAWGARRLVGLVWLIHASVAAAVAFPFWRALRDVLAPLPEADALGSGLHLGALADLAELRPTLVGAVGPTLLVVGALGFVLGAAIAGGVLEVLGGSDNRPLGHRLGRGAGRFFGRLLRLALLVAVGATIVGGLAVWPFAYLTRLYFRAGWDPGALAPLGGVAVLGAVALLARLVLDAARIALVRSDGRVLPSLGIGARLVLGHPGAWCGVWLLNAALLGVVLALYLAFRRVVEAPTGWLLFLVVVGQQALVLARTALRVALWASEGALVDRLTPIPAPAPQPASAPPSPPPA